MTKACSCCAARAASMWFLVSIMVLFSLLYFLLCRPQALVKRSPSSGIGSTLKESSAFQSELRMPDSAIRHQNSSPSDKGKVTICDGKPGDEDRPKKSSVCKSIEGCQEELLAQVVRMFFLSYLLWNNHQIHVFVWPGFFFLLRWVNLAEDSIKKCYFRSLLCTLLVIVILKVLIVFLHIRLVHQLQQSYWRCSCFSWRLSRPTSSRRQQ